MMLSTICCRTVLLSPAVVVAAAILSSSMTMMPSFIVSPVYGFNTNHAPSTSASTASSNMNKRTNYNDRRRNSSVVATTTVLSLSPMDIIHAATATHDVSAQLLSDSSYALMEYPTFLRQKDVKKMSKLRIKYAQVIGRVMIIGINFLPNHSFHPEELAIQLFLLGVSVKPIIRSMKLFHCIASSNCNVEECELDFDSDNNFGLGIGIGGDEFECTYDENKDE
jgi:hypothetical protein